MADKIGQQGARFLPLVVKAYFLGTAIAAIALHIAIALIAPGGAGTMSALRDGVILFVLLIAIGVIGFVAFPILAAASWPFRSFAGSHPIFARLLASAVGIAVGGALTAIEFQIGPGDFWSGPLVGLVFGLVWFEIVRKS